MWWTRGAQADARPTISKNYVTGWELPTAPWPIREWKIEKIPRQRQEQGTAVPINEFRNEFRAELPRPSREKWLSTSPSRGSSSGIGRVVGDWDIIPTRR